MAVLAGHTSGDNACATRTNESPPPLSASVSRVPLLVVPSACGGTSPGGRINMARRRIAFGFALACVSILVPALTTLGGDYDYRRGQLEESASRADFELRRAQ